MKAHKYLLAAWIVCERVLDMVIKNPHFVYKVSFILGFQADKEVNIKILLSPFQGNHVGGIIWLFLETEI